MTTTPDEPVPDFVPDEMLLAFIDELPGEVIRWSAEPGSTEYWPMIKLEINPDGE